MKIKTSELKDQALNWAAATCVWTDRPVIAKAGCRISVPVAPDTDPNDSTLRFFYEPSTDWSQGGPIIECEGIDTLYMGDGVDEHYWRAEAIGGFTFAEGPTPLIAAMRCFVASKLGDEVDVPEELV